MEFFYRPNKAHQENVKSDDYMLEGIVKEGRALVGLAYSQNSNFFISVLNYK